MFALRKFGVEVSWTSENFSLRFNEDFSNGYAVEQLKHHRDAILAHLNRYSGQAISKNEWDWQPIPPHTLHPLQEENCVLPVRQGNGLFPLFCFHPLNGDMSAYRHLSVCFDEVQTVFGVQSPGIYGDGPFMTKIEDMARYYHSAIKAMQPAGPYFLCGWSLGGWIAIEVARLFHQSEDRVDFLGLLDTQPYPQAFSSEKSKWRRFLAQEAEQSGVVAEHPETHPFWSMSLEEKFEYLVGVAKENENRFYRTYAADVVRSRYRFFLAMCEAMTAYKPSFYPGTIHFFEADQSNKQAARIWGSLSDQCDVTPIPGGHVTLIWPDYIKDVSRIFMQKFREIQAKQTNADLDVI